VTNPEPCKRGKGLFMYIKGHFWGQLSSGSFIWVRRRREGGMWGGVIKGIFGGQRVHRKHHEVKEIKGVVKNRIWPES